MDTRVGGYPTGGHSDYSDQVVTNPGSTPAADAARLVMDRMLTLAWSISAAVERSHRRLGRRLRTLLADLDWAQVADDPTGRGLRTQLLTALAAGLPARSAAPFREAVRTAITRDERSLLPPAQQRLLTGVVDEHLSLTVAAERSGIATEDAPGQLRLALSTLTQRLADATAALPTRTRDA
ncbi:hypothetical protein [Actinokineospora sp.]|uniref:hypothetical protein n=1 Tax=Actinokineospora sp. TaxID=1872133 RepID=UPI004037D22B